jgi:hypothetical protein
MAPDDDFVEAWLEHSEAEDLMGEINLNTLFEKKSVWDAPVKMKQLCSYCLIARGLHGKCTNCGAPAESAVRSTGSKLILDGGPG